VRASIAVIVLLAAITAVSGCKAPPEPLIVDGHMIRVENRTKTPWTDVEIWVNDHYRVTRRVIAPGERFEVPLDAFVAGFGQRFDVRRQAVKGVQVNGKQGNEPLKLVWGDGKRG
jgi:hypothetical protein